MKRIIQKLLILSLIVSSCTIQDEIPTPVDHGYFSMNISLTISSEEANGRLQAVDTDNFKVTVFDINGNEIIHFDPFSSAPSEVALPTGQYYVEAHSNNLVDAAFESPYFFGRSSNFTIDKEEVTPVDIITELSNTKVAILFSDNVVNTFDSYTGNVTVTSTGSSLFYGQGEMREGYFISDSLSVDINLSYTKLDGTTIDRTLIANIDDPQPKTLYNINVDASLVDGKITFNLLVDESFDTVDISIGDIAEGCRLNNFLIVEGSDEESWAFTYEGLNISEINYSDNYGGGTYHYSLSYDMHGNLTFAEGSGSFIKQEVFLYNADNSLIERQEFRDEGIGLNLYRVRNYLYNGLGQIDQIEEYDVDAALNYTLQSTRQYYYASNNPNRVEIYNGSGILINVEIYQYDNNLNPVSIAGLWACDDCIDYEFISFAENNITRYERWNATETVLDSEVDASYQYNVDGYPVRVDYVSGNGDSSTEFFNYLCQ